MSVWVTPAPTADRVLDPAAAGRGRIAGSATTALLVISLALAAIVALGAAAGYRGQVILSGSMEPAISKGDLVVVRTMPASEMRAGQIVSFQAPSGINITHRVKTVTPTADGRLAVVTQGDANNVSERWKTAPNATVGRLVTSVPKVGLVTRWTGGETGRLLVLGSIGLLLGALALRKIWST